MDIIGYTVFTADNDPVSFTTGDFEAEADRYAGSFDEALVVPMVEVEVITLEEIFGD